MSIMVYHPTTANTPPGAWSLVPRTRAHVTVRRTVRDLMRRNNFSFAAPPFSSDEMWRGAGNDADSIAAPRSLQL